MGEETKKISFGFCKLSKKTSIIPSKHTPKNEPENSNIEFIEGFESNSIKFKHPISTEQKVLVIPLKRPSSVAVIEHLPTRNVLQPEESVLDKTLMSCKPANELLSAVVIHNELVSHVDKDPRETIPHQEKLTLDELAAKEILDDLTKDKAKSEAKVISVPLSSTTTTEEKESTLDDYENVPVGDFGIAMLRGMGWTPGKGIGKNEKLVAPALPLVRPKGMGLGADKVIKLSTNEKSSTEDDLKMSKGSFIRVIAGPNKDCYGQIEGFDDESGRTVIKLAVKNLIVSLNEFMFQLVNKKDFDQNSKVLNVGKYEQYKKAEGRNESYKILQSKSKSRSKSPKECKDSRNSHSSRSESSSRTYHSSHSSNKRETPKVDKSITKHHRDNSTSSGKSSASSSSDYSRTKQRTKKKKPRSHRLKSRSRSRSPRKNKKHKKEKSRLKFRQIEKQAIDPTILMDSFSNLTWLCPTISLRILYLVLSLFLLYLLQINILLRYDTVQNCYY